MFVRFGLNPVVKAKYFVVQATEETGISLLMSTEGLVLAYLDAKWRVEGPKESIQGVGFWSSNGFHL